MSPGVPESDWKVFRQLREVALEELAARVLAELMAIAGDASQRHHERYLAIWELLRERDREVARCFDNPGRSRMIEQLAAMHGRGLLSVEDLERFTQSTRSRVAELVDQR